MAIKKQVNKMKAFNPCIKEEFEAAIKEVVAFVEGKESSPYTVEDMTAMREETKRPGSKNPP